VNYAHQRGVIHRDLKPDNIFVLSELEDPVVSDSSGSYPAVKVLDFGLARIMEPDGVDASRLSHAGEIKGTLQYMSPEQVSGNLDGFDVRTDVYSLGIILFELLYGCPPYDVRNLSASEAIRIICEVPAQPLKSHRKMSRDLVTISIKMLE
jgi:serine/threonine protein kinase